MMQRRRYSRRHLAATLAGGGAAATVVEVSAAAAQAPDTESDLDRAKQSVKRNAEQLAKVKIGMAVEPAFKFVP